MSGDRLSTADDMDDAIHILYPGNTTLTLCKQTGRLNTQAITVPWPDSWGGCWTCLREAEKIASRPGSEGDTA